MPHSPSRPGRSYGSLGAGRINARQIVAFGGPAGHVRDCAGPTHQAARQRLGLKPVAAARTADDRGGAGDVRVQTRAGAHADGAPDPVGGTSGGWVDEMVYLPG